MAAVLEYLCAEIMGKCLFCEKGANGAKNAWHNVIRGSSRLQKNHTTDENLSSTHLKHPFPAVLTSAELAGNACRDNKVRSLIHFSQSIANQQVVIHWS
mmetsp:Transcript_1569/g.5401  ORF Transcript_1569/g.5401 Transcript_1569/m.5401 type:complete len:99 (+) Transcript_1569:472-768(+)